MRNQGSIFKGPRPAINHQLLGRHGHDPHAPIFDNALDLHVMDHGHGRCWLACRHCLRVDLIDHLLGDGRVRVRHNDLDLGIFLGQDLQGLVIQARVLLDADLFLFLPPVLGNAALPDQGIFEQGIRGHKPVVVRGEDQVCIVSCLLRTPHVLWAAGNVLNDILGAEKHAHEAWHHGAHSVAHFHGHNLASPLFLVAKGVTPVVLGALGANGTQVGVDVADRVLEVRRDDALQLTVIHLLGGRNVGAYFQIVDHILTFFKTTYMDSTALGVRSN